MAELDKRFSHWTSYSSTLRSASSVVYQQVLGLQRGEKVLIITNPDIEVSTISFALYDAAIEFGGEPILMFQPVKTQLDFCDPVVLEAMHADPDIIISMSKEKMGKDPKGLTEGYLWEGVRYDHYYHLLLSGTKSCRSFWSPGVTIDSFERTVPVDYETMRDDCAYLREMLDKAIAVHIRNDFGTDLQFGLAGRKAFIDDGDFSKPGSGGNLPAGESFISPENFTASGTLVFDGSISSHQGDIIIKEPIKTTVKEGFVTNISGGKEAGALLKTIELAEKNALVFEKDGKIASGKGETYRRNSRNIGELGIGMNRMAKVTGNMLEDEKIYGTCHIAIGSNYDDDMPALIHLDGIVSKPTITLSFESGGDKTIMKHGELLR